MTSPRLTIRNKSKAVVTMKLSFHSQAAYLSLVRRDRGGEMMDGGNGGMVVMLSDEDRRLIPFLNALEQRVTVCILRDNRKNSSHLKS